MPKIAFFHDADSPMIETPDSVGASRARHPGGSEELQLVEVRLNPNQSAQVHAHKQPEIMYVVQGQMTFGAQLLRVGDSVSISGLTLYTFTAGPEGVRFVNFRPREDMTFFTPDQLREYQRLDGPGQAAMERRNSDEFMARINWGDSTSRPAGVD
jgi:hypothetical protein